MDLWLVHDVPAWLVGLVLITGLPAVTLCLDTGIHRRMPHRRLGRHNDVTGVIVSVVGVAYALILGLCVVSLWDGYTEAERTVRAEAVTLTALVPGSTVFGAETQATVAAEIVRYERDIITDWRNQTGTEANERRTADLDRLTTTVAALRPATEAQRAFVEHAVRTIGEAEQLRHRVRLEADDGQMSTVMWIGVLSATAAILGLCVFFGLDDTALRRILLGLVSAVIAVNLFLVVEMNYPYHGAFSVGTGAYETAEADLRPVP